ncbi:MAG: hypothetical protein J5733_01810 [Bacteroidaceae bacterium]|nr:hypothetical protein [Bacteroidaceae bacterium]
MRKILLSVLLLFLAGFVTMNAQPGMVVWKNGQPVGYRISDVDRVEFVDNVSEYLEREYVDLGLPSGTLWATCNVGAENPEESGDYFAWGETETKASYYWDTYTWMNEGYDSWSQINKYTFEDGQTSACWYSGGAFVGDGKKNLSMADDAAAKNWGSQWQMPTRAQFEELINTAYTTSEFTTQNGVNGLKVTGKNGNSIFLPAAGNRLITDSYYVGNEGRYWSRSLSPSYSDYASFLSFNSSGKLLDTGLRAQGCCIRPVRVKEHKYVELGLPSGTLWATCNIGADSPEEYGDYFAWGETEPKSEYSWNTYFYTEDGGKTIKKYNLDGDPFLLPEDDAATANWGSDWQMPTSKQFYELRYNTTTTWTTQNGVNGVRFTGTNGNSIFLPAAGSYDSDGLNFEGMFGTCWTSEYLQNQYTLWEAYVFSFGEDETIRQLYSDYRSNGNSVRPVRKK